MASLPLSQVRSNRIAERNLLCRSVTLTLLFLLRLVGIPTTGSSHAVILNGSNFGVLGPIVTLGGVPMPLIDNDHDLVMSNIPLGQTGRQTAVIPVTMSQPVYLLLLNKQKHTNKI